jgi:hypothetical protein
MIKIGETKLFNCGPSRIPHTGVNIREVRGVLLGIKSASFAGLYKATEQVQMIEPWN